MNNININEDNITIQITNTKLRSRIFKHGYHNITTPRPVTHDTFDDTGIYLYTPQRTRSEIAYFYLDTITIRNSEEANTETEDQLGKGDWLQTLRENTILNFKTRQNDPLTLPLDDFQNIYKFYEDYFYLFNTRYVKKHTAMMDNYFYEFISLVLYEVYTLYADTLYQFITGLDAVTAEINTTTPVDDEYDVLITLVNNRTGRQPEDGLLQITLNGVAVETLDVSQVEDEITYHVDTISEQTLQLTYTHDEYSNTNSYIIPYHVQGVNITAEDVTAVVGESIVIPVSILGAEDDSLVNEGFTIFKLNGKTIKDDEKKVLRFPVVNGGVTLPLNESLRSGEFSLVVKYYGEKFYTGGEATITLTITPEDLKFNIEGTPIVTVDGVLVIDGTVTEIDDAPLILAPEMAYKFYGRTTLVSLLEGGILPSNIKLIDIGSGHAGVSTNLYIVSGLNKYYTSHREEIPLTIESEPLWDVTYTDNTLTIDTTGFLDGQEITVSVDDEEVGSVTVHEDTASLPYTTSDVEVTVTLTATLTNGQEYTESFTLTTQ